jgi:hypothetical protein
MPGTHHVAGAQKGPRAIACDGGGTVQLAARSLPVRLQIGLGLVQQRPALVDDPLGVLLDASLIDLDIKRIVVGLLQVNRAGYDKANYRQRREKNQNLHDCVSNELRFSKATMSWHGENRPKLKRGGV